MQPSVFWLAALIVFAVAEAVTVGLASIWFAVGALGALAAVGLGAPIWVQIVVFLALSAVSLVLVRPIAQKFLKPGYSPTNADRVIGTLGIVTEKIDNMEGKGLVNLSGQVWTARSTGEENIPEGAEVRVLRIEGVKVFVEMVKKEHKEAQQ